ncbi:DUF2335 domain-containing protein [Staphylococcus epidermidis]|uniref:DUF2335 domain-containing protein n=1 Tax=Staphylococcus epidermidis TaxID=1282 RepID=UPI0039C96BCF
MVDNKIEEVTNEEEAEVLKRLVDEADPEERKVILRKLSITKSGPLPDSKEFGEYEKALPGAGDRILQMAEDEQENRIELSKKRTRKLL